MNKLLLKYKIKKQPFWYLFTSNNLCGYYSKNIVVASKQLTKKMILKKILIFNIKTFIKYFLNNDKLNFYYPLFHSDDKDLTIEKLTIQLYNKTAILFSDKFVEKSYFENMINKNYIENKVNLIYSSDLNTLVPSLISKNIDTYLTFKYERVNIVPNDRISIKDVFKIVKKINNTKVDYHEDDISFTSNINFLLQNSQNIDANIEKLIIVLMQKLQQKINHYSLVLNHGDLWNSNILYNGTKYFIIDYDNLILMPKLYDIIYYIFMDYIEQKVISLNDILLKNFKNISISDYEVLGDIPDDILVISEQTIVFIKIIENITRISSKNSLELLGYLENLINSNRSFLLKLKESHVKK